MSYKILSVIVSAYNMEAYLPKCLGSLVVRDKDLSKELDVIVVNDGSKDRTSEIAHGFETKYPGVFRVIDKANGHYGSCINAALPIVKGEYVKVLDADDWVDTVAFEKLLRGIDEELKRDDLAADLIVSDYDTVDPEGGVRSTHKCDLSEDATTLMDVRNARFRFALHSICYRYRNLQKMHYRQTEDIPYTDSEWIIEPMITVSRLHYIPIRVTKYLIGRDGQTMDPNVLAKSFKHILSITEGLLARYENNFAKCEESAKKYYRQQVINMVEMSYSWGLLGFKGVSMDGDVICFDKALSRYPEFYESADSAVYGLNRIPFRYVKAWRKFGKNWYWKLRFTTSKTLLSFVGWLFAIRSQI